MIRQAAERLQYHEIPASMLCVVYDLRRDQHTLSRIKSMLYYRITVLYKLVKPARRRIERMRRSYPVRRVVGHVKELIRHPVPTLILHLSIKMILPYLGVLCKIGLLYHIRHVGFNDLKTVFLKVGLYIVVRSRMEIKEILSYYQDPWTRL